MRFFVPTEIVVEAESPKDAIEEVKKLIKDADWYRIYHPREWTVKRRATTIIALGSK